MTKSLSFLIRYSFVPAAILILAKLAGILLSSFVFQINLNFQAPLTPVVDPIDLNTISTYSDLFLFASMLLGMFMILVWVLYLHKSHVTTGTVNILAKYDLLSLIRSSFELYHAGVIWLIFLWVVDIIILINVLNAKTETWVFFTTFIFSLLVSIIFFRDVVREIELGKETV